MAIPAARGRQEIAKLLGLPAAELHDSDKFWDDLGVDSLKFIWLVCTLEKRLGRPLLTDQAEVETVADLMAIVDESSASGSRQTKRR